MAQIAFDESVAKRLEATYRKPDFVRRRKIASAALDAQTGEDVIDIGCGPGFYVDELAGIVGPTGSVLGVDTSAPMLAIAAAKCESHTNVTFAEGDAVSLPAEAASCDAAISVQVLEYVRDIPRALGDMRRILRPSGRVVLWDVDWSTMSWHSSDSDRMERVLRAWDEHLVDPILPRTLGAQLRSAGFEDVRTDGHVFVNAGGPDGYSSMLIPLIADFVAGRNGLTAEDAQAWAEDLSALSERGEYSCSVVQFCFSARLRA